MTLTLVLQWLPCQASGVTGPALGLVGPLSVYRGFFSWLSQTSDFNIGAPVATLPGFWCYRAGVRTGWPTVSIPWIFLLVESRPVTLTLVLQWLPCQASGATGPALGLVGPLSVYRGFFSWLSQTSDFNIGAPVATLPGFCVTGPALGLVGPLSVYRGFDSWLSQTSDFNIGAPVATLPGFWCYRAGVRTGWPTVSIPWIFLLVESNQ